MELHLVSQGNLGLAFQYFKRLHNPYKINFQKYTNQHTKFLESRMKHTQHNNRPSCRPWLAPETTQVHKKYRTFNAKKHRSITTPRPLS